MRGRKAIAGALSALMIATSVPTPALAEMLPAAPAAETPAADAPATETPAVDALATETPAVEGAVTEDAAADGATSATVDDAATEQGTVVEEGASVAAEDETAENEVSEDVAAKDAAPVAAADESATQAASDPYEKVAPAHDDAELARIFGTVSYRVGDGSANSTSVVSADNFARIGKPMKNNATGGWRIVATLKADGTAHDYGLRSWEVGGKDPASLFIDADASDLSIIFETSSATDGTWSVSSNARAALVFTAEQPQPAQPAQPGITDVIKAAATIDYTLKNAEDGTYDASVAIGSESRMANITSVYWNEGLFAWAVDVTLQQLGTPTDYGIDVPAFFAGDYALDTASSKFVTTLVYQDGAWVRAAGATASLVFTEQVAQAPAFDLSEITSKVLSYDITGGGLKPESYGMRGNEIPADMVESISEPAQNEDGGWDIVVTLKNGTAADYGVPKGYLRGQAAEEMVIDAAAEPVMKFTAKTDSPTDTTWTVYAGDKAEFTFVHESQVAPTFTADNAVSVSNTVNYSMRRAAGGAYEARTTIVSADNIESIGAVHQNEDGAWTVDVTLKADAQPSAYDIPEWTMQNKPYELSKDSKLVATFVWTKNVLGDYSWRCDGGNQAKLVFDEVAAPAVDEVAGLWGTVYYTLRNADGTEGYTVTTLVRPDNLAVGTPYWEDGAWKADVTVDSLTTPKDYGISVPAWYDDEYRLDAEDSKFTFTVTRNAEGTWSADPLDAATLVFNPVVAPAFDINSELLVYGTVTYDLKYVDGTSRDDNGTHLVSVDNIASVGTPYQTADGCWAVDVTLKDAATPDDYEVPNWMLGDGVFKLDVKASDLTLTFRTLSEDGATWYCTGADRANLVFVEQAGDAGEQPGGDGEQPGDTTGPDTKPGDVQPGDGNAQGGTSQTDGNRGGSGTKAKGAEGGDKNALPQTGDPATLGMVAFAAAGAATLAAGAEFLRRRA